MAVKEAGSQFRTEDMLLIQGTSKNVDSNYGNQEAGILREDRFIFPGGLEGAARRSVGLDQEIGDPGYGRQAFNPLGRNPAEFSVAQFFLGDDQVRIVFQMAGDPLVQ